MAKRKTPKVKDLKVKAEQLQENELKSLQELVSGINSMHLEVGRIRAAEHDMLHRLAGKQDEVKMMQNTLQDKYGDADIDVRNGKLTYKENEQVNS